MNFNDSDYVVIPYHSSLNSFSNYISISVWIRLSGGQSGHRNIISNNDDDFGFYLTISAVNRVRPHIKFDSGWEYFDGNSNIELDRWYHIAITYDGEIFKLYVDGNIDGSVMVLGNIQNFSSDLLIGKRDDNKAYFPGLIDEIIIWDQPLSQQQIQTKMFSPPIGFEQGLVGCWLFNAGSGIEVYDLSGNGNHGTIDGAAWFLRD